MSRYHGIVLAVLVRKHLLLMPPKLNACRSILVFLLTLFWYIELCNANILIKDKDVRVVVTVLYTIKNKITM